MTPVRCTCCFLINESEQTIVLAMKKRGFGAGKWNGAGGKLEGDETFEENAIREVKEELGVKIALKDLDKATEIMFNFKDGKQILAHYYLVRHWQGEPSESEEMAPKVFKYNEVPYDQMWVDDILWLPEVLKGNKFRGEFFFNEGASAIEQYTLEPAAW